MDDEAIKYPRNDEGLFKVSADFDELAKQYAAIGIDLCEVIKAPIQHSVFVEDGEFTGYSDSCLTCRSDAATASISAPAGKRDWEYEEEIDKLKHDLEAKDAKFKEKSKEYDEILVEKNHQLDVLRNTIMMLENKIRYCKKNGVWAENIDEEVSADVKITLPYNYPSVKIAVN